MDKENIQEADQLTHIHHLKDHIPTISQVKQVIIIIMEVEIIIIIMVKIHFYHRFKLAYGYSSLY